MDTTTTRELWSHWCVTSDTSSHAAIPCLLMTAFENVQGTCTCAPMPYGLCLETLCSPVICLPWQRWSSESHTWEVNICHCEPSISHIDCHEESHQVGQTQHPPCLSLAAGLNEQLM